MYGKMFHNSIVFQSAKIHIYFETDVKNVANEQIIFPPEENLSTSGGSFTYIGREFYLDPEGILSLYIALFLMVYRHAHETLS